ncbi:MAG: signal peptide peptidase SppA [Chitinophagaceae bacterium]|nr:signal peptide peptidase SppA [Chitinophagaceae bacterium]
MNSFFKIFFASLLALVVFSIIGFFILIGVASSIGSRDPIETGSKAVLVLDLSIPYSEVAINNPFAGLTGEENSDIPSVYDLVRLIHHAVGDSAVKGIYLKCGINNNSFGTSEDIRNALIKFRNSGKFVYAYADVISQGGYYVANVSNKIFCNPKGGLDWRGYSMSLFFLKGTLEKLEIEPQIFYAGKFKSATEPLRETKMTEANRLQTTEILNDLYGHFLTQTSAFRKIDTATLHGYANANALQTGSQAVKAGLLDGLKYDDEVQDEIRSILRVEKTAKLNLLSVQKYAEAVEIRKTGTDKIMVIYAQGDIIDGKGERTIIGSESYVNLVRKGRLDKSIKAIVFRINSGGGSAMASENIWRELSLARKEKPIVVSFGDVAASGGYYLSCNADSIFAQPNTITGSIGVFSILPNMQGFFNNKLGITFDGVKTSPDADALSVSKPLTPAQRQWIQNDVDSIYATFIQRVADGRKKDVAFIDSIAQGRIWSGTRALQLGLIDRIGGLQEAIDCAARMAKTNNYKLREYPEPERLFERFFGRSTENARTSAMREEIGEDGMKIYQNLKRVKQMVGVTQTRLPFDFVIE